MSTPPVIIISLSGSKDIGYIIVSIHEYSAIMPSLKSHMKVVSPGKSNAEQIKVTAGHESVVLVVKDTEPSPVTQHNHNAL